jgi:hypothetical protein
MSKIDIDRISMVYYNTRTWGGSLISKVMFKASRFPCGVSDVMVVLLLCLIVSLTLVSLPARGSQDPPALGMNHVLPLDQVANVNAPPLEGLYYPFALAEQSDDHPVNSGLLRMLFLAVSFLGTSVVGWLHTKAQGQGALCFLGVVGKVLGRLREEYLPFLGVFRL